MSVGSTIYDLYWYQLPAQQQLCVQTIIQRLQKAYEIKGLGVFVCSLEMYLKVRRMQILLDSRLINLKPHTGLPSY